jgi:hypothetical protein
MRLIMLAAGLAASPALAQHLAVERADGLEAWLAAAVAAESATAAQCVALKAAGGPPDGRVWLRWVAGGLSVAGDGASAEAAAWWAEATLGAREAAAALFGGDARALDGVMIEAAAGRIAMFDGRRMAQTDLCGALARVAAGGAGQGAASPAAAAGAATQALLAAAVGGEARATVSGLDFAGPALARGPDGVGAEIGPVGEDGRAALVVRPGPGAAAGLGVVRVYAEGDPFRPRAVLPLRVLPGAAPPEAPATLAPGGTVSGRIPPGGAAEVSLELAEPARLRLVSLGPEDLSAALETAQGVVVATGDDTPDGYGFSLEVALEAGAYRLRVAHCCGGGGAWRVRAEPR